MRRFGITGEPGIEMSGGEAPAPKPEAGGGAGQVAAVAPGAAKEAAQAAGSVTAVARPGGAAQAKKARAGRITTIASQKGGVGKTTATLNLGYALSRLSGRVLLVDLDPQGGLAIASNLRKKTTAGIVDVLKNQAQPADVIVESRDGSLAIVGAGTNEPDDVFLLESAAWHGELAECVESIAAPFACTLIDAPAGVGSVVRSALQISNSVILVMNARSMTLKSLPVFLKLIQDVTDGRNPGLKLDGVLLSMVDAANPVENRALEDIRAALPAEVFFKSVIPRDPQFEAASQRMLPVAVVPESAHLGEVFLGLAMEMRQRELSAAAKGGGAEADGLF